MNGKCTIVIGYFKLTLSVSFLLVDCFYTQFVTSNCVTMAQQEKVCTHLIFYNDNAPTLKELKTQLENGSDEERVCCKKFTDVQKSILH